MLDARGTYRIDGFGRRLYTQRCDGCNIAVCFTSNQYVDGDYVYCQGCLGALERVSD